MNFLSRRAFLKDTALSLALLAGGVCLPNSARHAWAETNSAAREILLLCDAEKTASDDHVEVVVTYPGSIKGLDVRSGQSFKIDIPFLGHTVIQNPARPDQVIAFEKWGRRGALADVREKKLITTIETEDNAIFFGHAAFLAGGSAFVASEDNYQRSQGQLTVRDASTLKLLDKISSYGAKPHECRTLDNGKTILVVNEGTHKSPANIAWIESASGKLMHMTMLDFEKSISLSHVDVASDGWLCVVGFVNPRFRTGNSRIFFISPEGHVLPAIIPPEVYAGLSDEVLSVAVLGDSGLVAVTIPASGKILVLDYKTQQLVATADIPKVKGVVRDLAAPKGGIGVLASNARDKNLMKVDFDSLHDAPVTTMQNVQFGGVGSHLTRIYV